MPVSIHRIVTDSRHLTLRVEIAEKEDAVLLHVLFEDVLEARLHLRRTLKPAPLDPDFIPFNFPLRAPFDLSYNLVTRSVLICP